MIDSENHLEHQIIMERIYDRIMNDCKNLEKVILDTLDLSEDHHKYELNLTPLSMVGELEGTNVNAKLIDLSHVEDISERARLRTNINKVRDHKLSKYLTTFLNVSILTFDEMKSMLDVRCEEVHRHFHSMLWISIEVNGEPERMPLNCTIRDSIHSLLVSGNVSTIHTYALRQITDDDLRNSRIRLGRKSHMLFSAPPRLRYYNDPELIVRDTLKPDTFIHNTFISKGDLDTDSSAIDRFMDGLKSMFPIIDVCELINKVKEYKCVFTGSYPLRCAINGDWDCNDVDIFTCNLDILRWLYNNYGQSVEALNIIGTFRSYKIKIKGSDLDINILHIRGEAPDKEALQKCLVAKNKVDKDEDFVDGVMPFEREGDLDIVKNHVHSNFDLDICTTMFDGEVMSYNSIYHDYRAVHCDHYTYIASDRKLSRFIAYRISKYRKRGFVVERTYNNKQIINSRERSLI